MTLKITAIAAFVALIISGAFWLAAPAKVARTEVAYGNTSIDGSQAVLPNPTNYDYLVARLALGFGTNTSVSSTGAGNVNQEAQRQLTIASTTPCAIQNPLNATSTILTASMNITTATSSATTVNVGTSTSAFATTTSPFLTTNEGASSQFTATWDGGTNNSLIGPTQWVYFSVSSAAGFNSGVGGTCQITVQSAT